jgi:hypothetical protein
MSKDDLVVGHGASRALSADEQRQTMAHMIAKAVAITNDQKSAIAKRIVDELFREEGEK